MSTQRFISTSFWDDEWVQELDQAGKLFYLYLLTNPLTNIAGVYKISDRRICFDCNFDLNELKALWEKFSTAKKAVRYKEWVILPSWPSHQRWDERDRIARGIISHLQELPDDVFNKLLEVGYKFDLSQVKKIIIKRKERRGFYNRTNSHTIYDIPAGERTNNNTEYSAHTICEKNETDNVLLANAHTIAEKAHTLCETAHKVCANEHTLCEKSQSYVNLHSYLDSDLDTDLDTDTDLERDIDSDSDSQSENNRPHSRDPSPNSQLSGVPGLFNEVYLKKIYEAWAELGDKAIQPSSYIIYLNQHAPRDILPSVRGIHSSDVLIAIENYKQIICDTSGRYYTQGKIGIGQFFRHHLEKYLPKNFSPENFVRFELLEREQKKKRDMEEIDRMLAEKGIV